MMSAQRIFPVELHKYSTTPPLLALVHPKPNDTPATSQPTNYLLFIPGLGDGLLTVQYAFRLASKLPANWRLAEVELSSAHTGWGVSSVAKDANEIESCVAYFQSLAVETGEDGARVAAGAQGKIVLMGHSTGCQDVMQYLISPSSSSSSSYNANSNSNVATRDDTQQPTSSPRPPVQGAIFQAPVSDRESMLLTLSRPAYDDAVSLAKSFVERGTPDELLPRTNPAQSFLGKTPCTASRFLSLACAPPQIPNPSDPAGAEDFFSSDLGPQRLRDTFGKVGSLGPAAAPLCFLYSGADEHVPAYVDKEALLARWTRAVVEGGGRVDEECSGLLAGASHNLNDGLNEEVLADVVGRVVRYLGRVEG